MVYDNYGAKGTADKAMPKIKPGGMCIATLAMTPVAVARLTSWLGPHDQIVIMMMMDDVIRTCMVFLIGTSTYIYIYILTQLVLEKRTGAYLLLPGGENGAEIFCFGANRFILETERLPRQARNKHEDEFKKDAFLQGRCRSIRSQG